MARIFNAAQGFSPPDFIHSGLDHLTAARSLFETNPSHYDSAGYLAHIGVELLLKGWLLESAGQFEGIHNLQVLYQVLIEKHGAKPLSQEQRSVLLTLDQYEQLRYPNPKSPTEVGEDDWPDIEAFAGFLCRSMPSAIENALNKIQVGRKGGRILMRKKKPKGSDSTEIQ